MAKTPKRTNPVVLRQGMTVGSANAETDEEYLSSCFVHYAPVDEFRRVQSAAMIVAGRTGSGKTAILKHILSTEENAIEIDPYEMSVSYVSNSDVIRFVQAIGGDLDLLFQILWKHVICLEFIRLRWQVQNEDKSRTIFERIAHRFSRDERRQKSISYLRQYKDKFWIPLDENVKEITKQVESKLSAEFGADVERFKLGGNYDKRLSADRKSELVTRFRKIISSDQLMELHGVIDILDKESDDAQVSYYIAIDRLDERWVDSAIRFRMIRALIESLKTFRKVKNLKILVALRLDVLERVVQETQDISFQREKFEDYSLRLRWTKAELKQLIEKRISMMFRRQYSGHEITFEDVFPNKIKNRDPFDYILDRTMMRPRDVIAFVNECLAVSDGQSEISVSLIQRAEVEFSRKRRDALEQEWSSVFPTIKEVLEYFASLRAPILELKILDQSDNLESLALTITVKSKIGLDPVFDHASDFISSKINGFTFLQEMTAILYRIGAVGVKLEPNERYLFSHTDEPLIAPARLTVMTKFRFHSMLLGSLRLILPSRY